VEELRAIADEMQPIIKYADELSTAVGKPFAKRPRKFKPPTRPPMPSALNWEKSVSD
jgi:hypothetical protein